MKSDNINFNSANRELLSCFEEILNAIDDKLNRIASQSENSSEKKILRDWIPENEAQILLGKKATSLWKLRKKGLIKFNKVGNKIFYEVKSINELINPRISGLS